VIRGDKIKVSPERLATFQAAPLDVQDAVEKLKARCLSEVALPGDLHALITMSVLIGHLQRV
jgi:hypothetical protein